MLKSHILCVLFTVCGLSFALATLSGEVAEILRRGGRFFPCMWQVQPGICTLNRFIVGNDSNTYEWDTAAGELILAEAGGVTRALPDDAELKYNKENLQNPWFVCRGRGLDLD